jgi:hypothetical protein
MPQETAAGVTHVVHWMPDDLIRSRRWFGRKAATGYWELQTLAAYEACRADFTVLDGPDSGDAPPVVLAKAVSEVLGYPVSVEEYGAGNGKGAWRIPGLHTAPIRWIDAPVYNVRPAVQP